jgi:hypothetical protein
LCFLLATFGLSLVASPASASGTELFAYVGGGAVLPTHCPETAVTSAQCTLGEALSLATGGDTVALATPGSVAHYVGNWTVGASSAPSLPPSAAPLTIAAARGVVSPTLDGNHGSVSKCTTVACNGPVLTVRPGANVHIDGVTIEDAKNTVSNYGGAIENDAGGMLTISASTFAGNTATDGGAIDNADNGGSGTVVVSGSTFSSNLATGSKSGRGGGGAIDNAANGGTGTFSVSGSAFLGNRASSGGAIAIGNGTGSVTGSTFSGNAAVYGGAIDTGTITGSTLSVSGSTFSGNSAAGNGGAIDNGDGLNFRGTLNLTTSTFFGNVAGGRSSAGGTISLNTTRSLNNTSSLNTTMFVDNGDGGAIDNGDNGGTGTLIVTAATFSGNTAKRDGGTVANFTTIWASGDIFNGDCHESAGGIWNDEGYNVGNDTTCVSRVTGDVAHGAGQLGPLGQNGGPTKTMLPLPQSPAIGIIPYSTTEVLNGRAVVLCPVTDQRGVRSPTGRRCDAGAVQSAGRSS